MRAAAARLLATGRGPFSRVAGATGRRGAAIGAGAASAGALLLGLIIVRRGTPDLDLRWMAAIARTRSPILDGAALVFDVLGSNRFAVFVVPVAFAVVLLLRRRPWAALLFLFTPAVGAAVTQALKLLYARERPDGGLLDLGSFAYPSGHVANAATFAVLLVVLFPRGSAVIAGSAYVVWMALSRTYLGVHWATDTVGGALWGVAMGVVAWAVLAPCLTRERERRAANVEP